MEVVSWEAFGTLTAVPRFWEVRVEIYAASAREPPAMSPRSNTQSIELRERPSNIALDKGSRHVWQYQRWSCGKDQLELMQVLLLRCGTATHSKAHKSAS